MEPTTHTNLDLAAVEVAPKNEIVSDADQMPNSLLQRLMEEVKNDTANNMFAYDRAHNRHNRGR